MIHGMSKTRVRSIWRNMLDRCSNQRSKDWPLYGGRGITVCDKWRTSFLSFFHDMGHPPSANHSIDRIDNNGNYEHGNCRWATATQQTRNRRTSKFLIFSGRRQVAAAWCDETGISQSLLCYRLKNGWTVERALTTPTGKCVRLQDVKARKSRDNAYKREWSKRNRDKRNAMQRAYRARTGHDQAKDINR